MCLHGLPMSDAVLWTICPCLQKTLTLHGHFAAKNFALIFQAEIILKSS